MKNRIKNKCNWFMAGVLIFLFGFVHSFSCLAETPDVKLQLTMLDVGQGLSILCESEGEYLLYDGGGRDSSSYVVSYLKQHDIDYLRYMVVSHYDEDHIAGLIGVMHTTEVDRILSPDYETDTAIYQSFRETAAAGGVFEGHPAAGDTYILGAATIQVIGPLSCETANENNCSVAVRISCGDFSAVITGDAEYEEEQDIVNSGFELTCDLYVAGHHGSSSSSSQQFLDAMGASAAFISVGTDNTYGHPTEKTLMALTERGISIYRTDLQGEVSCFVKDGGYWFSVAETGRSMHQSESQTGDRTSSGFYVLNTNTKKFHKPECKSVQQMKDKNKQEYHGTRDEIIALGYSACGNCKP